MAKTPAFANRLLGPTRITWPELRAAKCALRPEPSQTEPTQRARRSAALARSEPIDSGANPVGGPRCSKRALESTRVAAANTCAPPQRAPRPIKELAACASGAQLDAQFQPASGSVKFDCEFEFEFECEFECEFESDCDCEFEFKTETETETETARVPSMASSMVQRHRKQHELELAANFDATAEHLMVASGSSGALLNSGHAHATSLANCPQVAGEHRSHYEQVGGQASGHFYYPQAASNALYPPSAYEPQQPQESLYACGSPMLGYASSQQHQVQESHSHSHSQSHSHSHLSAQSDEFGAMPSEQQPRFGCNPRSDHNASYRR